MQTIDEIDCLQGTVSSQCSSGALKEPKEEGKEKKEGGQGCLFVRARHVLYDLTRHYASFHTSASVCYFGISRSVFAQAAEAAAPTASAAEASTSWDSWDSWVHQNHFSFADHAHVKAIEHRLCVIAGAQRCTCGCEDRYNN